MMEFTEELKVKSQDVHNVSDKLFNSALAIALAGNFGNFPCSSCEYITIYSIIPI